MEMRMIDFFNDKYNVQHKVYTVLEEEQFNALLRRLDECERRLNEWDEAYEEEAFVAGSITDHD